MVIVHKYVKYYSLIAVPSNDDQQWLTRKMENIKILLYKCYILFFLITYKYSNIQVGVAKINIDMITPFLRFRKMKRKMCRSIRANDTKKKKRNEKWKTLRSASLKPRP